MNRELGCSIFRGYIFLLLLLLTLSTSHAPSALTAHLCDLG